MASRFWVGGTGNWSDNTNHWSATSGGAPGASKPGVGDSAIFGTNSGGGICTCDENVSVDSIFMGNYTNGTFDANDKNITCAVIFAFDGSEVRSLKMGNGTFTLSGTGVVWRASSTNLTMDAEGSTIDCTNSSGTSRTITGSSVAINHLKFSAGTGAITLSSVLCNNLDFTGFSGTWGTAAINIRGNLTLGSAMAITSSGNAVTFSATSGTKLITSNGAAIPRTIVFDGVGGTWQLADDINLVTRVLTLTNGTFDANDQDVICDSFSSNNSNTRSLLMGSGTWELNGIGVVWVGQTTIGMTMDAEDSTIKIDNATSNGKTFAGGGLAFNNIWFTGSGTGTFSILQSNTFNDFKVDTPPHTVSFEAGMTQSINSFTVNGTSGNLMTLRSSSPGLTWYLSKSSGVVSCDYISLQDSHAIGGASFNAGYHSIDVSNNEGWNIGWAFPAKPTGTPYTNVAKPTGANYTNVNTQGKEQYDQPTLSYDDASVFYDGVNYGAYTNVNKP